MKEEYLTLLKDLIQCRSVSADIPRVDQAEERMKAFLEGKGIYCNIELVYGRKVLYASTKPGKVQDLLLNAHLDVVPPVCEEQFNPVVKGDRIYGRGADDCLGNAVTVAHVLVE